MKHLSVIILTHNSENLITRAISSAQFADEIIVIDDHSSDNTQKIVKDFNAKIIHFTSGTFADKRNVGLKQATANWILYLDSDEEITPDLAQEIDQLVKANVPQVYTCKRENYFLGKKMYPDSVERLFHTSLLKRWEGDIHETPLYHGEARLLTHALIHRTHRDITSMLEKTNEWSEIEADLRIKAYHPSIQWWRLVRMAITTGWQQFVRLHLLQYGRAGLFEGYFQIIDKLVVYTKLWEKQMARKQ